MYKKKLVFVLTILLTIIIPMVSMANSLSLRSSSKTIEPGKTFTLSIYTDSSSIKSFTAQANIDFPADLVSVESFTYASSWFPITQTGYDTIDNTLGKLIKTAGYPSGFSSEILFGTLKIKAKKAGTVVISVNKNSYILDMDSNNTLTNYSSFSITSSAPEIKVVTPPVTPPVTKPVVTKPTTSKVDTPVIEAEIQDTREEEIRNRTLINNLFLLFNGGLTINEIFHIFLGFK